MRFICGNLMSALLFIHALLGCSWHHAHDENCCSTQQAVKSIVAQQGAGCSHGHGCRLATNSQQEQPTQPSKHKDCRGNCASLPPVKSQIGYEEGFSLLPLVAYLPWATDAEIVLQLLPESNFQFAKPRPPLRLHLLNQILLI